MCSTLFTFTLSMKRPKSSAFDKIQARGTNQSMPKNCLSRGKIRNSKEKRFPRWRTWKTGGCLHGRGADHGISFFPSYFHCINKSFSYGKRVANHLYRILRTLEVPAQEKRVIKNVCKGFVEPLLFLMHFRFSHFG